MELETWDSTPASITELPSFQPVDCPIPLRTEEIFDELRNDDENFVNAYTQQTTATLEDVLARHVASNAEVRCTLTMPRNQRGPVTFRMTATTRAVPTGCLC